MALTGATVAIGATGIALARDGGGDDGLPGPISLQDRVPVTVTAVPPTPGIDVVPGPIFGVDSVDDSPSVLTPDFVAPPPAPAADSVDSPDYVAPPPAPAVDSVDSPDYVAPPPSPADSFDSPDGVSVDGSVDSPDASS